jgi:hypothetical protein
MGSTGAYHLEIRLEIHRMLSVWIHFTTIFLIREGN